MEVRVLKYFLAVVREESVTRAAEFLHITQPTLSRQLLQLEEETGVKLFIRGMRRIKLTNEGILLRRRAEEIIALIDKTEKELIEREEMIDGVVSVGCGELAGVQVLADLLAAFMTKHPFVTYDVYTANADQIKERMDQGVTDIGLLLEPVDIDKYEFVRLNERKRWVVVMKATDPLAKKTAVNAADLVNQSIIMVKRPKIQSELASWFGDYFPELNIRFMSNMSTNAAIMVEKGLGYALVIEGSLPFWDKAKICYRPLAPELSATTVFAWKRQQPFSVASSEFIKYVKDRFYVNKKL